jgi:putative transport protein
VSNLIDSTSVAGALVVLLSISALGLALGALKLRGIGLSTAGVLFVGLLFGHLHVRVDERMLEFARELGLVLFVFSIGLQVGPGFFASLRRQGLRLNALAVAVVLLGVGMTLLAHYAGGVPLPAAVGVLAGATTNTPSLAAAQQALREAGPGTPELLAQASSVAGLGYAVAYPFGVLGIIAGLVALKAVFRVELERERALIDRTLRSESPAPARVTLEVTNPNLDGLPLARVPLVGRAGIVVSRLMRNGELLVPQPETELRCGDVLLAVGPREELDALRLVVGRDSALDLTSAPGRLTTRRVIVTRPVASGRRLDELDFVHRFGVQITRVARAEVELGARPDLELQYGDTVLAVGEPEGIRRVASELGDSPRDLNYPHLVPVFVGIVVGALLGSLPLAVPGIPVPVKLGLAGGPLLVALLAARVRQIGPLVWYLPLSANFVLREVGIALFLAAVGLRAGDRFVDTLVSGPGLVWLAWGAAVTVVPVLVVGAVGRGLLGHNFLTLSGVLAGSMTDPPALAFATSVAGSDAPALGYATVYPLTMILRVVLAQLVVVLLV